MSSLYLLGILPPARLSEQIHQIRLECSRKFGVQKALRPPVHITLYPPFWSEDAFEKQLILLLNLQTAQLSPFKQVLENFGAFQPRVVFIRAHPNQALLNLHQSIIELFQKHPIDKREQHKQGAFHPHITIAYRDVLPEIFPLIWQDYKDRKFKHSFNVKKYALLKHDGLKWHVLESFKLGGN
ncbi:MAG TPA: 2'-5' RNA ligase family protein [Daejeonella sp.]|nr:2'-5' RNA ligase family protein [Daejeonella sp.]